MATETLPAPNLDESNDIEPESYICKICSKRFLKKLARNRHQLYCRKKHLPGQPRIRKSCGACRRAKVKCNSEVPRCGKCREKGISCVYEQSVWSFKVASEGSTFLRTDRIIDNASSDLDTSASRLDFERCNGYDANASLEYPIDTDQPPTLESNNNFNSYSIAQDSELDGTSALYSVTSANKQIEIPSVDILLQPSFGSASLSNISEFSLLGNTASESMFDFPYLTISYSHWLHGSTSRMSAIMRRQSPFVPTLQHDETAIGPAFILANIKAYPGSLLNPLEAPPFVHNVHLEPNNVVLEAPRASEHLSVCKNIVQMYEMKTPQTVEFIWRTINTEIQHFAETYSFSSDWNVLYMLQSITIYIILRIFDDKPFTVDFDVGLIQIMTSIAIKLEQSGFLCAGEVHGRRPKWEEWMFMESKRRTVIVLFLICLLFDISPHQRGKALAGLSALPLPASRPLWQAETEEEWQSLYDEMILKRQGRRYLSYADLVFLGKAHNANGDSRMGDLNEWFVTLDGFGVLVMMAATTF